MPNNADHLSQSVISTKGVNMSKYQDTIDKLVEAAGRAESAFESKAFAEAASTIARLQAHLIPSASAPPDA